MEHHHHHHVHPTPDMQKLNRSFIVGIVLNIVFVLAEAGAGFYYDSLALLSDAGHNLSDVVSLVLAMFALRLSMAKPSLQYTYGYKKSTVLVSLLNAAILFVAVAVILYESVEKFSNPTPLDGGAMSKEVTYTCRQILWYRLEVWFRGLLSNIRGGMSLTR